jgi:methylenetetrahydrofolate reductase (NADPH)
VTASPKLGIDRTFDVSTALAARGYTVVPHLAARMVTGRGHLERLVQQVEGTSIREVFVIGGDADPPA